uniref:Uncharacterized protein n=2 Tax=Avena sativa TaxID=4498 RepID=A0ACD5YHA9_AVESA
MAGFLCFMMPPKTNLRGVVDDDYDGGSHRSPAVTADEFKEWLRRFDVDRDGRISRDELRRAMRALRVRFTGHRARRGISFADADGDGYIDDSEIDRLVEFARRNLGLRIVAC